MIITNLLKKVLFQTFLSTYIDLLHFFYKVKNFTFSNKIYSQKFINIINMSENRYRNLKTKIYLSKRLVFKRKLRKLVPTLLILLN